MDVPNLHTDGISKGRNSYVVWSDVFVCPYCTQNIVFYNTAYSTSSGQVQEEFSCPNCNTLLTKNALEHATETYYDPILKKSIKQNKQVPALISYSAKGKRYEKIPTKDDLETLAEIEHVISHETLLSHPMMLKGGDRWGAIWRAGYHLGITHSHHFYTHRNFFILNKIWEHCTNSECRWAIPEFLIM